MCCFHICIPICIPMLPMMILLALFLGKYLHIFTKGSHKANMASLRLLNGCCLPNVTYPFNEESTPPKFNIAPKFAFEPEIQHAGKLHQDGVQSRRFPKFNSKRLENWWLEDDPFLLGFGYFSGGSCLTSGGYFLNLFPPQRRAFEVPILWSI